MQSDEIQWHRSGNATEESQLLCGRSSVPPDDGYYEFGFIRSSRMKTTTNSSGTLGWGKITRATDRWGHPLTAQQLRLLPKVRGYRSGRMRHFIHLCSSNPCSARPNYDLETALHLFKVPKENKLFTVASAPAACSDPVDPVELAAVVEPIPVEHQWRLASRNGAWGLQELRSRGQLQFSNPECTRLYSVVETSIAEVPDCPTQAPLVNMKPPAPASLILGMEGSHSVANVTAVAATVSASPAVAARHTVEATLLDLARTIRTPKAYVGYSAFILMGLLKRCRPCVWEGSTLIDLLAVFAPSASRGCDQQPLSITAILCTLKQHGCAVTLDFEPISGDYPLCTTTHFVAGLMIPEPTDPPMNRTFEAIYASLGVAVLTTNLDGDCGLDVMTMMLGLPHTPGARQDLRTELSDYLSERIREPWLQDIMVVCQELLQEDVNLYRSGDAKIISAPSAPAAAVADGAVVDVDQNEVVKPDAETVEAMRWVIQTDTGAVIKDCHLVSFIQRQQPGILMMWLARYRARDAEKQKAAAYEASAPAGGSAPAEIINHADEIRVMRKYFRNSSQLWGRLDFSADSKMMWNWYDRGQPKLYLTRDRTHPPVWTNKHMESLQWSETHCWNIVIGIRRLGTARRWTKIGFLKFEKRRPVMSLKPKKHLTIEWAVPLKRWSPVNSVMDLTVVPSLLRICCGHDPKCSTS